MHLRSGKAAIRKVTSKAHGKVHCKVPGKARASRLVLAVDMEEMGFKMGICQAVLGVESDT